jgi:hypothetical protein
MSLNNKARTDGRVTVTGRTPHVTKRIAATDSVTARGAIWDGFDAANRNKHVVRKGRLAYMTEYRSQGLTRGVRGANV